MKRNLLLLAAFGLLVTIPANSAVTIEELTGAEYMINSGYSETAAEDVFVMKNRANGKAVEPLYEKNQNKFVKACKRFFAYIDPVMDNPDNRLHHDIKRSVSPSDL